jgi:NADH dehydrogenase
MPVLYYRVDARLTEGRHVHGHQPMRYWAGVTPDAADARSDARPAVVIVGGGFGGLQAARALAPHPVRVTLLDRTNHHLFQPLLYQVATAALSPGDIASPIRWILSRQDNVRVLMADVLSIDLQSRRVLIDGGPLAYDFLIVACGASTSYFGHPEWRGDAPPLKTLEDALDIRRRVLTAFEAAERERDPVIRQRHLTFVIVGGGPTGVELAGALSEIAHRSLVRDFRSIRPETTRVILVEAGPGILPTFPDKLRAAARRSLRDLGVEVREEAAVTAIAPGSVTIAGEIVRAETVVWAAGVAASPLVGTMNVPVDRAGRVIVQPDLSVPGFAEVFVVGDAAALRQHSGEWLPGLAPVAMQEGRHAAENIARTLRGERTRHFAYVDRGTLATIGRGSAIADFGRIRISGYVAWLAWLFIHLMMLVGFRNRLAVFTEWAWAYLTGQRRVRLITGRRW